MRTGLTKKQKVTEVYYNAKDPTAEVYTHDTKLKKRLLEYAAKFPELCQQTDDDEHGGLRFEIDKSRISIRLTAPYSEERRKKASEHTKRQGIHIKTYPIFFILLQENPIIRLVAETTARTRGFHMQVMRIFLC